MNTPGQENQPVVPVEGIDWVLPTIPVSCGAMVFDERGHLLLLKPTYKSGWTIPGGIMEASGETPWEACQREVLEETGLDVRSGRLVVVDTRGAKHDPDDPSLDEPLGIRFLFHCGVITEQQKAEIRLQPEEISECRFLPVEEALDLLRKRARRRVRAALKADGVFIYLEDGHPVDSVG